MRYRLSTLLIILTVAAVTAAWLRPPPVISQLRRDLNIPESHPIWIIERKHSNQLLAVFQDDDTYVLFGAVKWNESGNDRWEIPLVVGSGAPLGEPEPVFEDRRYYDHFPTEKDIEEFRGWAMNEY